MAAQVDYCSTIQAEPAEAASVPAPVSGTLYVDASQRLGPISPYVYGTNFGPWSVVPLDLMSLAVDSGISLLRFPGGNWGDENDITEFQLDNFINLARQMGAEPAINVRLMGGTPEAAARLVEYANIEKQYGVNYWGIGNEPELFGTYDTVRYNAEWREIAQAMQAVDEDIILIGPDVTQYRGDPALDPRDANGKYWIDEFLRANGDLVDIVSIHRYPFPVSMASGPANIEELRATSAEWDVILPSLRALVCAETGRSLPLAVTEFNSHWNSVTSSEATPDSHFNAIWLGDVIGRMIRQDVEIAAQFALQSSSDNGGWGIFSRVDPRPSYYTYQMYKHFGEELVFASSGVENVSIYAARTETGQLGILIINMDSQERQAPLTVEGASLGEAEIWLFDASHAAEQVSNVQVSNEDLILVSPESMTIYLFDN